MMNKIDIQVKYCLKSGTPQQRKPIMHNWGRKLKHHKVGFWEISKLGCTLVPVKSQLLKKERMNEVNTVKYISLNLTNADTNHRKIYFL